MNLIIVDVQNDFLPGGALAVPKGDEVIPAIKKLLEKPWDKIIFSRDWHPENHTSFAVNHGVVPFTMWYGDMKWPVHCVASTHGAMIESELASFSMREKPHTQPAKIFNKGFNKDIEEYSAARALVEDNPDTAVVVCGLATDYCVKSTALELKKMGWKVLVDLKACRGVAEDTTKAAIEEMKKAGVEIWE